MEEKIIMDEVGYKEYLERIEKLEKELEEVRIYKGRDAIFQGDSWHDNPTLYDAENRERSLMKLISEMKNKSKNIEIVKKENNKNIVDIGSNVLVEIIYDLDDIEEMNFILIGGETKNDNEVSINSPLGRAVYKKKINDKVSYRVGDNDINVVIKDIKI